MEYQHQTLAAGKWQTLSFVEQMGNIGSEVSRAAHATDDQKRWSAAIRAFELLDLTINDPRWRSRLKEIMRVREVFGGALINSNEYGTDLNDLDRYFFHFGLAARASK